MVYTVDLPESLLSLSSLIFIENPADNILTLGEIVVDSSLENIIDTCHELKIEA